MLDLKGGVAKTATAVNLTAILASDYKKTALLVDADSQCNATEFFGGDPVKGGLADALRHDGDGGPFAAACIQASNFPGVDLLCGSEDLMDLDLTKVELQSVRATVLREMIQRPTVRDRYDYCKVDAMTFAQEPLLLTSPRSAAGIDYREFVREYMERRS